MKLNLGAGRKPMEGAVNHDLTRHNAAIDVAHDLNIFPWPWKDGEFEEVRAWAVFEHLNCDRIKLMNECWRILQTGGMLVMKLPYWNNEEAHDDLAHYWFTNLHQFDQFDPTTARGKEYGFYTPYKWRMVSSKFSNDGHSSVVHKMVKVA